MIKNFKTLIIILILLLGIIISLIINLITPNTLCTEKACLCSGSEYVECNDCYSENYLFFSGIINLKFYCTSKEIMLCEEGISKGSKKKGENCKLKIESTIVELFSGFLHQKETLSTRYFPD